MLPSMNASSSAGSVGPVAGSSARAGWANPVIIGKRAAKPIIITRVFSRKLDIRIFLFLSAPDPSK